MRVIHGVANAVLMVTLIKPMARLAVRRWRRQAQESRAAAIGVPMQELFEAALVEELAPAVEALAPAVEALAPTTVSARTSVQTYGLWRYRSQDSPASN